MVPDRIVELLSAYADGELDPRQHEAVRQLLRTSAEARLLLQELTRNAERLRSLSHLAVPQNLADAIVESAVSRSCRRRPASLPLAERTPPVWIGFVTAASVLTAVFVGSFLYFSPGKTTGPSRPRQFAQLVTPEHNGSAVEATLPHPAANSTQGDATKSEAAISPPPAVAETGASTGSRASEPPKLPPRAPRKDMDSVFTTPSPKHAMFELVDPTTAMTVALRELDPNQLQSVFRPNESYRLEMTGSANAKALDALTKTFQAQGVQLIVDDLVQQRSKHPKWMTDYAVLATDLTPAELVDVIKRLAKIERAADVKRADAARFHDLVVLPLTQEEDKEMAKLLGIEPAQLTTPSDAAADVNSIRHGLLLAYNPARPRPGASKEIRRFLEAPAQRPPGRVLVFLVLRAVTF